MITDIDIKDFLYKFIRKSALKEVITGEVYKSKRPINSDAEDVIIAVVANQNGQLQDAVVNINVYILGDMVESEFGRQLEEPTIRAREISRICADLFEVINEDGYRFELDSQSVVEVVGTPYYCVSNKLVFSTVNE